MIGYLGLVAALVAVAAVVWPSWAASIVLVILALTLATFLPKTARLPPGVVRLQREECAHLYRALEDLCALAGVRRPAFLAFSLRPTVEVLDVGFGCWPRKGIAVGFPVWDSACDAARGALLMQVSIETAGAARLAPRMLRIAWHLLQALGASSPGGGAKSGEESRDALMPIAEGSGDTTMAVAGVVSSLVTTVIGRLLGAILRPLANMITEVELGDQAQRRRSAEAQTKSALGSDAFEEAQRLRLIAPIRWTWVMRGQDRALWRHLTRAPLNEIRADMQIRDDGLLERLLAARDGDGPSTTTVDGPATLLAGPGPMRDATSSCVSLAYADDELRSARAALCSDA